MRSGALAALGSERRAGPGPARPGGVRAVGQRRSRSRRVRAFGLSGEEAARAPVRPRGRPGAASPRPGGALRSEIPPVRALRAAGGRGGGGARPTRPQLAARSSPPADAMLIGDLSAAAPGAAFPSCRLLLGGRRGSVSSAREEKKAKQTNGLADAERSRPAFSDRETESVTEAGKRCPCVSRSARPPPAPQPRSAPRGPRAAGRGQSAGGAGAESAASAVREGNG